jgi:hypothetical protein
MIYRSYISILTFAICLASVLTSYGQSYNTRIGQTAEGKSIEGIRFDTSKTAIIPFDQNYDYPFDNSYRSATLTEDDIIIVDSLLISCVTVYNNSLDKDHKEWTINLKKRNYRKQLLAVTNKNGEKEVWVNCFCDTWGNDKWKTQVMLVQDGGNCYFNFKVNLATKKFYDFGINGVASNCLQQGAFCYAG